MKAKILTVGAAIMAIILSLQGCSSSGGSADDYSDADPNLTKNQANFFSTSGWQACGVGVIGGILGCLASNSSDKLNCALIAGSSGCALMMSGNYLLDRIRADYKNAEDQLDETNRIIDKDLNTVASLKDAANSTLTRDKREVSKLNDKFDKGLADLDELNLKRRDMDANLKYLNASLKTANERLENYKTARNGIAFEEDGSPKDLDYGSSTKLEELDKKIAALNADIDSLYQTVDQYSNARNSLKSKV